MKFCLALLAFAVALLAPGCVMVQVGVTNPIPGLTTVAVAPFINLSAERAVDGRRFALTYASELQKVPGFEVLPVGVVEVAMTDAKLDMNDVGEVLKLAKILRVDAIVVGSVIEYSPYYPPRIGMQVNWYSPRPWAFYPGIQIEPAARGQLKDWDRQRRQDWRDYHKQLDDATAPETPVWERAYRCFKRWPGVRTLYGEPTLVWNDGPQDAVYRAQSPLNGMQYSTQRPGQANTPFATSQAGERSASGAEQAAGQVKIAYYQELQGMPAPIRLVGPSGWTVPTTQAKATQPSNDPIEPLDMPSGGPSDTSEPGGDPDGEPGGSLVPGRPAPLRPRTGPWNPLPERPAPTEPGPSSDGFDVPPAPAAPGGNPAKERPGREDPVERSPFDEPERGVDPDGPEPLPPTPEAPRASGPASTRPAPIRDPALAPCPPQANPYNVAQPIQPWQTDPRQPLMSYTRVFDGSDADLVAALRDYVELNGDLRSGGWEAYLHRSDDFIRFTSFRMILEMLSLHGGEGKHRMILKFRKYR